MAAAAAGEDTGLHGPAPFAPRGGSPMKPLSTERLHEENLVHSSTGGRSEDSCGLGFRPAFLDFETQTIYPCRFANGLPAPFHLLDGLPD